MQHLTKNGLLDKRWTVNKTIEAKEFTFWQKYGDYVSVILLGLIVGSVIGVLIPKPQNKPLLDPRGHVSLPKIEVEAKETPFCYDPITCIRDVGEELGETNQHIMTMIRLAKCESSMNPSALNKNKNGTFDVGLLQINDVHGKRISRQDRMDYEKNIRFGYQLHQEQGHKFTAWSCYKKVK